LCGGIFVAIPTAIPDEPLTNNAGIFAGKTVAEQMLVDIEKNTVDFMPNYDDRLQEPTVLPAKIPALLVNITIY